MRRFTGINWINYKTKIMKIKSELKQSFTDEQVKEQVDIVLGLGRRTIEDSFKLGEMLTCKKSEKAHGDWLPYLEEIGLSHTTADRLMKAFEKKDELIKGMSISQLVQNSNCTIRAISKDKQPDWFDDNCSSSLEALALRVMVRTMKKVEQEYGVVYLNDFMEAIAKIFEEKITHLNYKETWNQ